MAIMTRQDFRQFCLRAEELRAKLPADSTGFELLGMLYILIGERLELLTVVGELRETTAEFEEPGEEQLAEWARFRLEDRDLPARQKQQHAIERLRERYGLEMTPTDLYKLGQKLSGRRAYRDPAFCLMAKLGDGFERWLINLSCLDMKPVWARCVYARKDGRVVTFLAPDPAELHAARVILLKP